MRDIVFQAPQNGWLLLLALLIIWFNWFLNRDQLKRFQQYVSSKFFPYLSHTYSRGTHLFKMIAWPSIWILACLALMEPEGNRRYLPTLSQTLGLIDHTDQTHAVLFLVDTSASMNVLDGAHGQSRLEEAKEVIQNTIRQLQGVSIALYAFTSELTPVVPQTLDYLFAQIMLRELHINEGNVGGTLFQPVMQALNEKIIADPLAHAYSIFLFSDGQDNSIFKTSPPSQANMQEILVDLPSSDTTSIHFYTVGVGQLTPRIVPKVTTKEGKEVTSQLEPELLKKIAEKGNGEYFAASEWNNWDLSSALANKIKASIISQGSSITPSRKVKPIQQEEEIADLYFQIPLGVAILLLLACLYLPPMNKKWQPRAK